MKLTGELRRLIDCLDRPDDWRTDAPVNRSDYDLNPDMSPASDTKLSEAAVLILLIDRPGGPNVLLTRRSDTLSKHTGQIAFPGGRLDPGETPVEAALRETYEEVGLSSERIEVLGLSDRYRTGTSFVITPVIAQIAPPFELKPNADEVSEIFEVPWAHLMDSQNHRRESMQVQGRERWFWAIPFEDRYIWGATAGVIRCCFDRCHHSVNVQTGTVIPTSEAL